MKGGDIMPEQKIKYKFKLRIKGDIPIEDVPVEINSKEGYLDAIIHLVKGDQLVISMGNSYRRKGAIYITGTVIYKE